MEYNAYAFILEYHNAIEERAIAVARGMVWSEIETTPSTIVHARYVDTVNGIDIYYDCGADYYFFCPADEQEGE